MWFSNVMTKRIRNLEDQVTALVREAPLTVFRACPCGLVFSVRSYYHTHYYPDSSHKYCPGCEPIQIEADKACAAARANVLTKEKAK